MAKLHPTLAALRALEKKVRLSEGEPGPPRYMVRAVPSDLARADFGGLALNAEQCEAFDKALAELSRDLRFEYLEEKDAEEAVWRLACEAKAKPTAKRLAEAFIEEYEQEPITTTCFFAVESLTTDKEIELFGVRLLPGASVSVPEHLVVLPGAGPIDSAIAVEVTGTSFDKMADRARVSAEHALRLLRATLRQHHLVQDRQLRFRLGSRLWFEDGRARWTLPENAPWPLGLSNDLVELANSQAMSGLSVDSSDDVDEHALIALRWFEKAQLDEDRLSKMLYLFFALEAILGDRSEGLKGQNLALRRALLGHATTGGFTHPARTYGLYDDVRSTAVHGGDPGGVSERELVLFTADIRNAINEFLTFAQAEGFKKRSKLLLALDKHKDRNELMTNLYAEDPVRWANLKPQ